MAVPPFDYEAALLACARGDQNAFQELYQHESPRMLALCTRMLTQSNSAEELMRDTFVSIWKNAQSYDPSLGAARAWIYSIMRYRALNRLRQSGRLRPTAVAWNDSLPNPESVHALPESGLAHAISRLDEDQRRPILMAFYNGYTYEQIATRLKAPAAQIKMQVQEGLRQIREQQAA
ncbi:sigma-70 family RNA polymerase sigma factor [Pollutimonas bauzanensis]|jgi:RNA polymerase sigma-70 factor (ECF subfamily)|uniref:sigma-70 family RNA polymerase sigma factor n=1 Tax=Pollutimonas bauzanensis TaxID=658167 RepID=UPI0033409BAA